MAPTIVNRDPQIEKMVGEMSKDGLESFIQKLVSFGAGSTLSSQTYPVNKEGNESMHLFLYPPADKFAI